MKRASILLISVLALFSSSAFSEDFYYPSNSSAQTACIIKSGTIYKSSCVSGPGDTYLIRLVVDYIETFPYTFYYPCSSGGLVDVSGVCVVPPPTDEECQNTAFTASVTIDLSTGAAPKTASFGGCSFSISYDLANDADVQNNCKFNSSTPDVIICPATAQGTGATSNPDSAGIYDVVPVGDYVSESGGDQLSTTSETPLFYTSDLPSAGDTTESQTQTDINSFGRIDEVYQDETGIDVTSFGSITETQTTQTDTVTKPNGDVETTVTESFDSTGQTEKKTHISPSGDVTTNETPAQPVQGSTTTVTNNYNDGSTNTTTTNTGSGGDGKADSATPEGNCAAGEECEVSLSFEGLENTFSDTKSAISSIGGLVSDKEGELLSSISDDEGNNYGIDGVSDFNADSFVSRYFSFPVLTCSGGINTTIFGRPFVIEPCAKLAPLREVLGWVFFMITMFTVIKITFRKVV